MNTLFKMLAKLARGMGRYPYKKPVSCPESDQLVEKGRNVMTALLAARDSCRRFFRLSIEAEENCSSWRKRTGAARRVA